MKKGKKNDLGEITLLRKRVLELEKQKERYEDANLIIEESYAYARNIVDTVREPLVILNGELKTISANRSFYETFKVDPKETEGLYIYDLGNRQWNIPELRKLLGEIVTKENSFDNYEIRHKFETIGERIMLLNARRIPPTPVKPRLILLAIEDITEKKMAEKETSSELDEKVKERVKEFDRVNKQLQEKVAELEIFNKAAIGRELKMVELKNEIKRLKEGAALK